MTEGFVILLLAGAGIYAIRASFIVGGGRLHLPARVQGSLGHARAAVLGALIVGVLTGGGAGPAGLLDPVGLAVVVAAALVARRAGTGPVVLAGLGAIAVAGLIA
jgi:branched-subunit amino acid transport protein